MKKIISFTLIAALALAGVSCQTTYDAYGNPRQSVDPGTAVAGAAAVGVLGYALANKRNRNDNYNSYNHGYYNGRSSGYYPRRGHYHH